MSDYLELEGVGRSSRVGQRGSAGQLPFNSVRPVRRFSARPGQGPMILGRKIYLWPLISPLPKDALLSLTP
jgi:hypothetical protein